MLRTFCLLLALTDLLGMIGITAHLHAAAPHICVWTDWIEGGAVAGVLCLTVAAGAHLTEHIS